MKFVFWFMFVALVYLFTGIEEEANIRDRVYMTFIISIVTAFGVALVRNCSIGGVAAIPQNNNTNNDCNTNIDN